MTARAALDGEKTPIEIADEYYGTHFGDVKGWVQGQYPAQVPPPGAAPRSKPDESTGKRLGRIYVTYTKLNKMTHRYYTGRTSMVVDLDEPLRVQAALAVLLRDRNHHLDENAEPEGAVFDLAQPDRFNVGTAVDYSQRYDDVAYWRIRGREQQLIDFLGGARSDTGEPYRTENAVRGVAKERALLYRQWVGRQSDGVGRASLAAPGNMRVQDRIEAALGPSVMVGRSGQACAFRELLGLSTGLANSPGSPKQERRGASVAP
ncbi:MAG TPA: hypothetical protein VEU33_03060 [Archangium sp.]|nr:hypothetical protein [Archangium sp.]